MIKLKMKINRGRIMEKENIFYTNEVLEKYMKIKLLF